MICSLVLQKTYANRLFLNRNMHVVCFDWYTMQLLHTTFGVPTYKLVVHKVMDEQLWFKFQT